MDLFMWKTRKRVTVNLYNGAKFKIPLFWTNELMVDDDEDRIRALTHFGCEGHSSPWYLITVTSDGKELRINVSTQKPHRWEFTLEFTVGLPWWHSGWESACQCRAHGFDPWSGKIPHAAEQLGPCTTTTEPARLEPVPRNKRGRDSERPAHRDEGWPPLAATRESPCTETKTQHSHK